MGGHWVHSLCMAGLDGDWMVRGWLGRIGEWIGKWEVGGLKAHWHGVQICLLYPRWSRIVHSIYTRRSGSHRGGVLCPVWCSTKRANAHPVLPCSVPCLLATSTSRVIIGPPAHSLRSCGFLSTFTLSAAPSVSRCRGRDMTETAQRPSETPAWLAARPRWRSPPSSLWLVVCDGDGAGA